jgi:AraC-like DNA-binding protein
MVNRSFCLRNSFTIPPACRERFVPLDHPAVAAWRAAGVTLSGVSEIVPGYAIANTRPQDLMLIVTVGGRGWAVNPDAEHDLVPGTLFIGAPGQAVGWGITGNAWRLVWWYLRPGPRWQGWDGTAGRLVPCPRAGLLAALVDDLLDRCRSGRAADGPLAELAAAAALAHLDDLAAGAPEAAPAAGDAGFARLWAEIRRDPQQDWSAPRIAERLGVSLSTLRRVARKELGGSSLHQALIRLRLGHARELLERTDYPIRVIAGLAGYADAFTFSAAFRTWAGVPPKALRRAHRGRAEDDRGGRGGRAHPPF